MFGSLATFPFLLAQAVAPVAGAGAAADPAVSPYAQYLQFTPYLAVFAVFYFLLIRPGQQQEKKRREMLTQLKKNDKVLTSAGMYGTVVSVDPESDRVVLRIDEDGKVKVAFARSGIVRVENSTPDKK